MFVYNFHFNSDFSGDVLVTEPPYQDTLSSDNECKIPGEAFMDLLSYLMTGAVVNWAEQLDLSTFLETTLDVKSFLEKHA